MAALVTELAVAVRLDGPVKDVELENHVAVNLAVRHVVGAREGVKMAALVSGHKP